MLPALHSRFHFGLDSLERDIVDAKTVLRHKLNQIHAQQSAAAAAAAAAAAEAADALEAQFEDDPMLFEFDDQDQDPPEARETEVEADVDEARRMVDDDKARRVVVEEARCKAVEERIRVDEEAERRHIPDQAHGTGAESSPIVIDDDDSTLVPLPPGQGPPGNFWDEKVPPPRPPQQQAPPPLPAPPPPPAQPLMENGNGDHFPAADQSLPPDQPVDDAHFAEFLASMPDDGAIGVDGIGAISGMGDDMQGITMGVDDNDVVMDGGGDVSLMDGVYGVGANETVVAVASDGNGGAAGASKAVDETDEDGVFDF